MDRVRTELTEKGFARIPPEIYALDATSLASLKAEFEALFDGEYATGVYPDEIHWRRGISKDTATKELCNAWKSSPIISDFVTSEKLGSLACDLMGWNASRLGQDDIIDKPKQSTAVGFHQDGAYISNNFVPQEENCLTIWIAIDDADEENGALQYAVGSHRWPKDTVENVSTSSFHMGDTDDYLSPLRRAAQAHGLSGESVENSVETVKVRAGEMVVHHQRVWHGSGPNRSHSRRRRALVAHLIDGEVEWRLSPRPHYIYGRYFIRGESVPREDFFPVTFSKIAGLPRTSWLDG